MKKSLDSLNKDHEMLVEELNQLKGETVTLRS